jgi:hypothetical protein
MSGLEKDFNKVMALAERIQDELVFQKHPLYKKFKAKYQSQVPQGKVNTETLFRVLSQGQLQRWTEHSTLIFENLKPLEISKSLFYII